MECQDVLQRLGAFFDGELAGSDFEQVKQHLVKCQTCQQEFGKLTQLSEMSKTYKIFEPNEDYWSNLPNRIVSQLPTKPAVSFWEKIFRASKWTMAYRLAGVVATAVVIFVVTRNVITPRGEMTPKSTALFVEEVVSTDRRDSDLKLMEEETTGEQDIQTKEPKVAAGKTDILEEEFKTRQELPKEKKESRPVLEDKTTLPETYDVVQLGTQRPRSPDLKARPHPAGARRVTEPLTQKEEYLVLQDRVETEVHLEAEEVDEAAVEIVVQSQRKLLDIQTPARKELGLRSRMAASKDVPITQPQMTVPRSSMNDKSPDFSAEYYVAGDAAFRGGMALTDTISAMHEVLKLCQTEKLDREQAALFFFKTMEKQQALVPMKVGKDFSPNQILPKSREAAIVEAADLYYQLVVSQQINALQKLAVQHYQNEKKTLTDSLGKKDYKNLLRQLQQVKSE